MAMVRSTAANLERPKLRQPLVAAIRNLDVYEIYLLDLGPSHSLGAESWDRPGHPALPALSPDGAL